LLSTENRFGTANSRYLIHNPWTITAGDDEALFAQAKELTSEKMQLANKYAEISGKPVEEILALMKEQRILTANEALGLNLIKEIKTSTNLQTKNEDEKMTKEESEKVDGLMNKVESLWNKLFPSSIKNLEKTDVNGVKFTVEREDGEIQVGDKAQPDGSYTIDDGSVIVVEGREVTSVTKEEPAPDETAALKTENEALKKEIEALKAAKDEMSANVAKFNEAKKEMDTLVGELKNYKSKVVIEGRQQNFNKQKPAEKTLDKDRYNELDKKLK